MQITACNDDRSGRPFFLKTLVSRQSFISQFDYIFLLFSEHTKKQHETKKEKESFQERRNVLYREENKLQAELSSLKDDLVKYENNLRTMVGKPTLNGRDSVNRVLETFKERGGKWKELADGYYGLVVENFSCAESMNICVEVTASAR